MPKLVDHRQRRGEIVQATWRLLAAGGVEAVTMREIAREVGLANGALNHYFRGKDDIVLAAFAHVAEATDARIAANVGDATGMAALRAFCLEVMPLDEERLLEARIVLPFWPRAAVDPRMAARHERTIAQWRVQLTQYLEQCRADGDVTVSTPDVVIAEQLMSMMLGMQATAVLTPASEQHGGLLGVLDDFLTRLAR